MAKAKSSTTSKKKAAGGNKKINFEASLEKLETIVESLEEGDLSLDQALKQFEEGIALTRACQQELAEAEQTIKVLSEKSDELVLEDFESNDFED